MLKHFNNKSVGIVVGARHVGKTAYRYQSALRHVGLTDNHLARVCPGGIGICVEIAYHAVNLHDLIDISGYDTVVVTLLREIGIIIICRLVAEYAEPG